MSCSSQCRKKPVDPHEPELITVVFELHGGFRKEDWSMPRMMNGGIVRKVERGDKIEELQEVYENPQKYIR